MNYSDRDAPLKDKTNFIIIKISLLMKFILVVDLIQEQVFSGSFF